MEIHYTSDFIKGLKKLPKDFQELVCKQEEIFRPFLRNWGQKIYLPLKGP